MPPLYISGNQYKPMNKQEYSLSVGGIMIAFALLFFLLPIIFSTIDAFIPVMLSIVSFVVSISFFLLGHSEK